MPSDPMLDNSPLAPLTPVNGRSPGSSAENSPLAQRDPASGEKPMIGDLAASRIAAGQKTLLRPEELTACGLGEGAVAYRLKTGRLHVVFRGVYSFGCGDLPPFSRELAGLLACGERSFVSHRSAAFVWGLIEQAPAEVDVSVVDRGCRSRDGLRVHRIQGIDRRELRRREGLWVSSPARICLVRRST
jgi:hypothetical protein